MLKGLDPLLDADLLYLLAARGHGDDLALVDRNFPADSVARATVTGQLVRQDGVDTTAKARAILSLFPLDSFVEAPIQSMEVVGEPETLLEVHQDMQRVANQAEGREVTMASLERFAFYEAVKGAYAVIATAKARPYGCFILKKGVVFD
jgi:L-fucose mutarotase